MSTEILRAIKIGLEYHQDEFRTLSAAAQITLDGIISEIDDRLKPVVETVVEQKPAKKKTKKKKKK